MTSGVPHIGIIAGTAEGAALCYRTLCAEAEIGASRYDVRPEITLHSLPLHLYLEAIDRDDWAGVSFLLSQSASKLAQVGADFIICPNNTLHQVFGSVEPPIPWLHIATPVVEEIIPHAWNRVGILGTRTIMEGSVYVQRLQQSNIDVVIPSDDDRIRLQHIIRSELIAGLFTGQSRVFLQNIIAEMKSEGAEAVILGCTELPLILTEGQSVLPLLDSTRLLARAALRHVARPHREELSKNRSPNSFTSAHVTCSEIEQPPACLESDVEASFSTKQERRKEPIVILKQLIFGVVILAGSMWWHSPIQAAEPAVILNVSYDPTRELYQEFNAAFAKHWQAKTGQKVTIKQSHGGSSKQARAVIDGLEADVVTLALAYDIDAISEKTSLLPATWQTRLPHNSAPYTSTIAFLVRKGNPKNIKDWSDLVKSGVSVITPNPKTSGVARWNYLAAWGYALKQSGGDDAKAKEFITQLFKNVPVLDSGARGATTTFVERGIGDVLINWENEILLGGEDLGKDKFDIVVPPTSILAEPTVSVVDKIVDKRGSRTVAQAYLEYLYSDEGQEIAAKHYYRPSLASVAAKHTKFPKLELFTLQEFFGDWQKANKIHFADGGTFDQVYLQLSRERR